MDNEVYSAQDINQRFSDFLSEGVILAGSGNILADLNSATEEVVSSGVVADSCAVVKDGGGYKISSGTCLMQDGSAIVFDDEGYRIQVEPYVHCYVYFKRNEPENRIDIVVSATAGDGDFVPVAEITDNGDIFDRRKYAQLKVNTCQAGTLRNLSKEFYYKDGYKGEVFDLSNGNFSYIIIWKGTLNFESESRSLKSHEICIQPIYDGKEKYFTMIDNGGSTRCALHIRKNGQYLEVDIEPTLMGADYSVSIGVI